MLLALPRRVLLTASLCAHVLCTPPLCAQQDTPILLVSLTSNDFVDGLLVEDQALALHRPDAPAWGALPSSTFALHMGDGDGDGADDVFGDVDALYVFPGEGPVLPRLLLSLVSDQYGFLDGDVLGVGASGFFELVVPESTFVIAVGALDGDVDVDALHREPDGTWLFSLADDEDSDVLSGDQVGRVLDGAVLRLPAGGVLAEIVYTETGVGSLASAALGASAVITDTKGLARDPTTGALLLCTQNPSSLDGAVFTDGGVVLSGHAEADFGFAFGGELDALEVVADAWPGLTASTETPVPGSSVVLYLNGARPFEPYLLMLSFSVGEVLLPAQGWGGLVLSPDAAFQAGLDALGALTLVSDEQGTVFAFVGLAPSVPAVDVVLQAVSLGLPRQASNPLLLEIAP